MAPNTPVRRFVGTVAASLAAVVAVMAMGAGAAAAAAGPKVTVKTVPIKLIGQVDLSSRVFPGAGRTSLPTFPQGTPFAGASAGIGSLRVVDPAIARRRLAAGPDLSSSAFGVTTTQVPGEAGFSGLNGYQQAVVNNNTDLEPPDQGLCAGNGYVGEFINNAFAVYDPNGDQLLNTTPSYALFKQPSTAFLSDPRCYFDQATQRWFLTQFVVGNASGSVPSVQFIAVSNTADPMSTYSVWAINTTDRKAPGCPCFGDFDQLGVDNNGVYIATNEFSVAGPGYGGAVIYALSKQLLESYRNTGVAPVVFRYRVTADQFGPGPYHISPASTPPGALFAPDTEYFVESNGDASSDDHLLVYAMKNTSLLASPQAPSLVDAKVTTQSYSFPPNGTQKPGPIPLGNANQDPEGTLQSDFDAIQEVTYVNGHLLAEASTTSADGNVGAAWFDLVPHTTSSAVSASVANQGVVSVAGQSLLYPVIAVDSAGSGYMGFTLTGPAYFPSAAYQTFTTTGPSGPVRIAAAGADPEDGFTCYAAFVGPNYGGCRWGDYSMGVAMGSAIFLATEYIPPTSRDYLTNWGTYVWNAPAP